MNSDNRNDANSHNDTDNIDNDNRYHNINDHAQVGLKSIMVAYHKVNELNCHLWYR